MTKNLAIQINSLKNECEQDLEGTLSKLSSLGFKAVEFGPFFGKSPEEITALLSKYNLKLAGTHVRLEDLLDNFDEIIRFQEAINGTRIVIMYGDIHGSESLSMLISNINIIELRLRHYNIDLFYHNYDREFKKYSKGEIALAEIMKKTNLFLEFDISCAQQAGADVSEIINTYSDRIKLVHLKDDLNQAPKKMDPEVSNCKLVNDLSFKNIVDWIIVENYPDQENPMQAIEKFVKYIKENY